MSEDTQELNPTEPQVAPDKPPASLEERVAQLENTLDQIVLLMSDTFRYGKLRELLEAKNWREADLETTRVMLEIANQPKHDNLKPDEVMLFPCSALHLLDRLWLKYSDNQFGFSVQRQIYTEAGGTDDISNIDLDLLTQVSDRLGWRENNKWLPYDKLNFSLEAPSGCHPSNWWRSAYGAKMAVYFLARLMRCGV